MKTIVEINSTNYASTGNIMLNIAKVARDNGFIVYTASKKCKEALKHQNPDHILFGIPFERFLTSHINHLTGLRDHLNILGTYLFIYKLKKIKPDLIHLHVLHDDFINIRIFFNYLKKCNIPVIWTFHDCSAFTGQCPYFELIGCDKWQTQCFACPQVHGDVDSLFFDTSKIIYNYRKKYFTSLKNLTIITPSKWLKGLVKQSYFSNCNVLTINNGIDLDKFKPINSTFRKDNHLENKHIILGVANQWSKRKGLDVFIELANKLNDSYQIVLVGTNNEIDKQLPNNIISIHRTYNQEELVKIYSASDIFVNPTREENFPTVNIEALACGIPVITFKTGGSTEIIDGTCGSVVNKDDIDGLISEIKQASSKELYIKENCVKRAKLYCSIDKFNEYINLYKEKTN